jgi:hypothetical protein
MLLVDASMSKQPRWPLAIAPARAAVLAMMGVAALLTVAGQAAGAGNWSGRFLFEWLDDSAGSKVKLLEAVKFTDADGSEWEAPRDAEFELLSVSPTLQTLFGPPFEGKNRKAALLHQYQVHARAQPWKESHRMYYQASRSLGVDEADAKLMYMALYADGPRWAVKKSICERACHTKEVVQKTQMTWRPVVKQTALEPVVEWIERENPSLDQIDARVETAITAAGPHLLGEVK